MAETIVNDVFKKYSTYLEKHEKNIDEESKNDEKRSKIFESFGSMVSSFSSLFKENQKVNTYLNKQISSQTEIIEQSVTNNENIIKDIDKNSEKIKANMDTFFDKTIAYSEKDLSQRATIFNNILEKYKLSDKAKTKLEIERNNAFRDYLDKNLLSEDDDKKRLKFIEEAIQKGFLEDSEIREYKRQESEIKLEMQLKDLDVQLKKSNDEILKQKELVSKFESEDASGNWVDASEKLEELLKEQEESNKKQDELLNIQKQQKEQRQQQLAEISKNEKLNETRENERIIKEKGHFQKLQEMTMSGLGTITKIARSEDMGKIKDAMKSEKDIIDKFSVGIDKGLSILGGKINKGIKNVGLKLGTRLKDNSAKIGKGLKNFSINAGSKLKAGFLDTASSLKDVGVNLGRGIKKLGSSLKSGIGKLGSKLLSGSKALASNPLVWKAAAVAAVAYGGFKIGNAIYNKFLKGMIDKSFEKKKEAMEKIDKTISERETKERDKIKEKEKSGKITKEKASFDKSTLAMKNAMITEMLQKGKIDKTKAQELQLDGDFHKVLGTYEKESKGFFNDDEDMERKAEYYKKQYARSQERHIKERKKKTKSDLLLDSTVYDEGEETEAEYQKEMREFNEKQDKEAKARHEKRMKNDPRYRDAQRSKEKIRKLLKVKETAKQYGGTESPEWIGMYQKENAEFIKEGKLPNKPPQTWVPGLQDKERDEFIKKETNRYSFQKSYFKSMSESATPENRKFGEDKLAKLNDMKQKNKEKSKADTPISPEVSQLAASMNAVVKQLGETTKAMQDNNNKPTNVNIVNGEKTYPNKNYPLEDQ